MQYARLLASPHASLIARARHYLRNAPMDSVLHVVVVPIPPRPPLLPAALYDDAIDVAVSFDEEFLADAQCSRTTRTVAPAPTIHGERRLEHAALRNTVVQSFLVRSLAAEHLSPEMMGTLHVAVADGNDDDDFTFDAPAHPEGVLVAVGSTASVSSPDQRVPTATDQIHINPLDSAGLGDALAAIRSECIPGGGRETITAPTVNTSTLAANALLTAVEENEDEDVEEEEEEEEEEKGDDSDAYDGRNRGESTDAAAAVSLMYAAADNEMTIVVLDNNDGDEFDAATRQFVAEQEKRSVFTATVLSMSTPSASVATVTNALEPVGCLGTDPTTVPPPPFFPLPCGTITRRMLESPALLDSLPTIVAQLPDPTASCIARALPRLFGHPGLPPLLIPSRAGVFCLAKTAYDGDSEGLHGDLMAALYFRLTGDSFKAGRSNWQTIGFQREGSFDTDLRGAGMLGPLQMLWLVEEHPRFVAQLQAAAASGAARGAFNKDPLLGFPLMAQSLSLTAMALGVLRAGRLNGEVVERKDLTLSLSPSSCPSPISFDCGGCDNPVLTTLHECYAALFHDFMCAWQASGATSVVHLSPIMRDTVEPASEQPAKSMARWRAAVAAGRA